jgi:hypothetical protein
MHNLWYSTFQANNHLVNQQRKAHAAALKALSPSRAPFHHATIDSSNMVVTPDMHRLITGSAHKMFVNGEPIPWFVVHTGTPDPFMSEQLEAPNTGGPGTPRGRGGRGGKKPFKLKQLLARGRQQAHQLEVIVAGEDDEEEEEEDDDDEDTVDSDARARGPTRLGGGGATSNQQDDSDDDGAAVDGDDDEQSKPFECMCVLVEDEQPHASEAACREAHYYQAAQAIIARRYKCVTRAFKLAASLALLH